MLVFKTGITTPGNRKANNGKAQMFIVKWFERKKCSLSATGSQSAGGR